jgi:hypothetical protein
MAKTQCDLYRSVMDKSFKSIKVGTYPGDGVLDPRWEATEYYSKKLGRMVTSKADVEVEMGKGGPEVIPGEEHRCTMCLAGSRIMTFGYPREQNSVMNW